MYMNQLSVYENLNIIGFRIRNMMTNLVPYFFFIFFLY